MADVGRPVLSLVVPVYGVEDYVADCLDSITSASGFADHCELVIVDDGSLDGSMAIVEQRCAALPNVEIIRQANAGLGAARNTGISHARGRYIWFIDSDDEILPDGIDVLVRCIDRVHPDVIAFEFETTGGTLKRAPYLAIYERPVTSVDFILSGRPPSGAQFYAFSRDLLDRLGLRFRPGIYHEDALFTPQALIGAETVVRVRDICYRYRLRAGSIMSLRNPSRHLHDMTQIVRDLAKQALMRDRKDRRRTALAREVGFALSGVRHYWVRTPVAEGRQIVSAQALLATAGPFLASFGTRNLINFARLMLSVVFRKT